MSENSTKQHQPDEPKDVPPSEQAPSTPPAGKKTTGEVHEASAVGKPATEPETETHETAAFVPDEAKLIEALRAGDWRTIMMTGAKMHDDQRADGQVTADLKPEDLDEPFKLKTLNSAQRLALHIIGYLAIRHWFTNTLLLDANMDLLWRETTDAIVSGLTHVDTVEFNNINIAAIKALNRNK